VIIRRKKMVKRFEPAKLHELVKEVANLEMPKEEKFKLLVQKIDHEYPGKLNRKEFSWIFNNANGAMGIMTLLYGSLSEYLIIFGSPIGTEGHSGRYWANVHDIMIEGEMWTYDEGTIDRKVFKPGDWAHLKFRRSKGYCIREEGWMLEYTSGAIPTMLPMGIWDNLFSNLDLKSVVQLFWQYGGMVIKNLLRGRI